MVSTYDSETIEDCKKKLEILNTESKNALCNVIDNFMLELTHFLYGVDNAAQFDNFMKRNPAAEFSKSYQTILSMQESILDSIFGRFAVLFESFKAEIAILKDEARIKQQDVEKLGKPLSKRSRNEKYRKSVRRRFEKILESVFTKLDEEKKRSSTPYLDSMETCTDVIQGLIALKEDSTDALKKEVSEFNQYLTVCRYVFHAYDTYKYKSLRSIQMLLPKSPSVVVRHRRKKFKFIQRSSQSSFESPFNTAMRKAMKYIITRKRRLSPEIRERSGSLSDSEMPFQLPPLDFSQTDTETKEDEAFLDSDLGLFEKIIPLVFPQVSVQDGHKDLVQIQRLVEKYEKNQKKLKAHKSEVIRNEWITEGSIYDCLQSSDRYLGKRKQFSRL